QHSRIRAFLSVTDTTPPELSSLSLHALFRSQISPEIAARVVARLREEPTVLAPRPEKRNPIGRVGWYAMSADAPDGIPLLRPRRDRKSTRLNSSHVAISYAVFCLKKKKTRLC